MNLRIQVLANTRLKSLSNYIYSLSKYRFRNVLYSGKQKYEATLFFALAFSLAKEDFFVFDPNPVTKLNPLILTLWIRGSVSRWIQTKIINGSEMHCFKGSHCTLGYHIYGPWNQLQYLKRCPCLTWISCILGSSYFGFRL